MDAEELIRIPLEKQANESGFDLEECEKIELYLKRSTLDKIRNYQRFKRIDQKKMYTISGIVREALELWFRQNDSIFRN